MPTAFIGLLLTTILSAGLTVLAGFIVDMVNPNAFYSAAAYAAALYGMFSLLGFVLGTSILGTFLERVRILSHSLAPFLTVVLD